MPSDHPRNVGPMQRAPRCGARTRSGQECLSPRVSGSARCRMHGGKGSGAPRGNRNAWKDGLFASDMRARRKEYSALFGEVRLLEEALGGGGGNAAPETPNAGD